MKIKERLQDKNTIRIIYILLMYSLSCIVIYFYHRKNVIYGLFIFIMAFLWFFRNRLEKKGKLFVFIFLTLFLVNPMKIEALSLNQKPSEIFGYLDQYFSSIGEESYKPSNYDKKFLVCEEVYTSNNINEPDCNLYLGASIEHKYDFNYDIYYYIDSSSYVISFKNTMDFSNASDYEPTAYKFKYGRQSSSSSHMPTNSNGSKCYLNPSSSGDKDCSFKVLYNDEDIIFETGSLTSYKKVVIYDSSSQNILDEEFNGSLSAVDGYTYVTVSAGTQIVLYPRNLQPFDFYLISSDPSLQVNILDDIGSNLSKNDTITHPLGNDGVYYFNKYSYSSEDVMHSRGVYITNFSSSNTPIKVGYKTDLFELLTFDFGDKATTSDGKKTFINTYDRIKDINNILDASDKNSGFGSILSDAVSFVSDFMKVFVVLGQLIYMFFNSMPPIVSACLNLCLVITTIYFVIKMIRG